MKPFSNLQEDLRKWFSKTDPSGDWKRINSRGDVVGPCAREPGEPKPKCMSKEKRDSLTKKERAAAVRAKRKHDPNPERKGEPINVSNFGKGKISEHMENLNEKNEPTNPELWSRAKSLARSKFDVYPSAYANGWASKWYKGKGGSWKTVSEEKEESEYDYEGDMARGQLQSIINNAQRVHDMLKDKDNLPEWVQSKITLSEDYISTVANYLMSEIDEAKEVGDIPSGDVNSPNITVKKGKTVASGPIQELSNNLLSRYKTAAGADASKADKAGDYTKGNKRFSGIMKATKKQFSNNMKKEEVGETKLQESGGDVVFKKGDNHIEKYGEDSFALYKDGKKLKYYTSIEAAKEAMNEEIVQEGRPSQRHPLEGHEYHKKTNAELEYIAKDAHKAAEAMKSHNTTAENKYRDQANDSATVRYFRQKSGMPDWYKKKYGHMKEETVNEVMDEPKYSLSIQARQKKADDANKPPFDGPYKKSTGVVTDKSGAKHGPMSIARNLARQAMKKQVDRMSVKEDLQESRKAEIVKEIMKKGKKKENNTFQAEPEITTTVVKADN
jgi:hypothetical protein